LKVAFVTEDGKTVCKHFGRARYYLVVDVVDGKISSRELVPKGGCSHGDGPHVHNHENEPHMGDGVRHQSMIEQADGCTTVVSGGMGMGAYQALMLSGIDAYITKVDLIDEALELLMQGKLDNNLEMLH
jgi:predicted Fe-Mo cluster-binding NifX family protein